MPSVRHANRAWGEKTLTPNESTTTTRYTKSTALWLHVLTVTDHSLHICAHKWQKLVDIGSSILIGWLLCYFQMSNWNIFNQFNLKKIVHPKMCLSCSRLHLFAKIYRKKTVKFEMLQFSNFFKFIYFCECKAECSVVITTVFIVTWSFRNHSNMLIWCSRNILYYYNWKKGLKGTLIVKFKRLLTIICEFNLPFLKY